MAYGEILFSQLGL